MLDYTHAKSPETHGLEAERDSKNNDHYCVLGQTSGAAEIVEVTWSWVEAPLNDNNLLQRPLCSEEGPEPLSSVLPQLKDIRRPE